MDLAISRISEINELQEKIEKYGQSVKDLSYKALLDARRIGQLLLEQQADLQKCNSCTFAEWVEDKTCLSRRSAYNYMDLFKYRYQILDCQTLNDSYEKVKEIKQIEQKTESEKAEIRVDEAIKTGVKPDGWRRGTDDKILAEKVEMNKRLEQAEKERAERIAKFNEEWDQKQSAKKSKTIFDEESILKDADNFLKAQKEMASKMDEWQKTLRLSNDVLSDSFIVAITQWLESKTNDNERLSACHDLIKVVKKMAVELQQKINGGAE